MKATMCVMHVKLAFGSLQLINSRLQSQFIMVTLQVCLEEPAGCLPCFPILNVKSLCNVQSHTSSLPLCYYYCTTAKDIRILTRKCGPIWFKLGHFVFIELDENP